MDHSKRIKDYFRTRTKHQNGVLKDVMSVPDKNHTVLVGDNDYLNLVHHREVLLKQVNDIITSAFTNDTDNIRSSVFLSEHDPHTALGKDLATWYGKDCYITHFTDLESNIKKYGPGLILVESIYSTSGAFAPLEAIVKVKKENNCILVVDESHSFGLYGHQGLGLLHDKNLVNDVEYVSASLAKAYATRAGIVFANDALYVKEHSYPFIFSSGLVQNDIVRLRAIWEVIKAADDRRERLTSIATLMRTEMNKVASVVDGLKNTPCSIVSIHLKNEEQLADLHRFLSARGILAAPFVAPATSPELPVLRFTVHCDVSEKDVRVVTEVVGEWNGCAKL
ncbi:hypothetical protein BDV06DRAFT_235198 [Aspergillus oleicola]